MNGIYEEQHHQLQYQEMLRREAENLRFTSENHNPEMAVRSVYCDLCDEQATASKFALQRLGWQLGRGEEFCPKH